MPVQSRWVTYKSYSGYLAKGGPVISTPVNPALHIDRAVWLSGQLEAGSWGTVQGYDGCAMSGGILHNIAVSPKDLSQGTFFALLREVSVRARPAFAPIEAEFKRLGWVISADGKLRSITTGLLIPGAAIRLELSGSSKGAVPKTGVDSLRAQAWAEKFFELLSLPSTFGAQSDYAAQWLADGNKGDELAIYRHFLRNLDLDSIIGIRSADLPPEFDLAMAVYHSFSVNAPGIAKACLNPILTWLRGRTVTPEVSMTFSKRLIRSLGTRKYGNWLDQPGDGSNRYDKTRKAVWSRPDLWDWKISKSLMPRDL